jgi:hypothetical protein
MSCFAFSWEFDGANIITGFLYFLFPAAIFSLVCLLLRRVDVLCGRGRRFIVEDWHMHTWKFVSRGWGGAWQVDISFCGVGFGDSA